MSIPGKSHSRVSIESLDFARVRTFYRRDRSWIAGVEGAIAGRSLTPFPADAGTPSRDKEGKSEKKDKWGSIRYKQANDKILRK